MKRLYVGSIIQYTQDGVGSSPVYEYPSLYVYREAWDCTEIDAEYEIRKGEIITIRDDVDLNQLMLHQIPHHLYTFHIFRSKSTIWTGVCDSNYE